MPGTNWSKVPDHAISVPVPSVPVRPVRSVRSVRRQEHIGAVVTDRKAGQDGIAEVVGRLPHHHLLAANRPRDW